MRGKYVYAGLILCVCILTGCYVNGRLYPVQGPLSAQAPPPIFSARMSGALFSGNLTIVLADHEVCTGTWGMVSRKPTAGNTSTTKATPDLSSAWDAVYGQGFYTSHILGARLHVQSELTGNKGTILHVELYRPDTQEGINEIKGVGKDNNGNLYKLVF